MLKFRINSDDLSEPWQRAGRALVAGDSRVVPFRNPMLENMLIQSPGQTCIVVRERGRVPARDRVLSASGFHKALGALRRWPLDMLVLLIDHKARRVRLRSGRGGNAPVFLMPSDTALIGDWDPQCLLPEVTALRPGAAALFLRNFDMPYGPHTLFEGLELAVADSIVDWSPGQPLRHLSAPDWPQPRATALRPGGDPVAVALDMLKASMERMIHPDVCYGSELSGGLDSALVSIVAQDQLEGLFTFGLRLPEMDGQSERRLSMIERFGFEDHLFDLEKAVPLAPNSPRWEGIGSVPWEETYEEGVAHLLGQARELGVSAMFTGFGGDELCGLHPGEPPVPSHLAPFEPAGEERIDADFLTSDALSAMRGYAPETAPRAAIEGSALETVAYGAALYMRHGIWPIHPLCTPELARFCAALPWEWRAGRRIEREMLRRIGCPEIVAGSRRVDSFLPALASGMRNGSFAPVQRLFGGARLARLGLVDRDRLQRDFEDWRASGSDEAVLPFYSAASLELALRQTGIAP
ncbi:asparagine synthase C-terminal domain-containing protein [Thalassococcus sp. S3]|uniref:asparagine synthase-related protein n=1 Tax=Thalassococcus sp. S3 TaxID=2017482 RepID=UPI001024209F|nr:asparagine synthase C-terminal domain-containing protein [Thalassococcus sp. S3]QBF31183.1 hypothetical protein CFI11_08115 [Thalassococcus sp. S3]